MIVDVHCHVGSCKKASQSAAELVAKMDQSGCDRAVVFPFVEGIINNDQAFAAVREFPDRCVALGALNPWETEQPGEAVENLMTRGARGLKLHPTLHGYRLSDLTMVGDICEVIDAAGGVLLVHGASDILNSPAEFALLAAAFPGLRIVMAHGGGFWGMDAAIEVIRAHDNLYADTSRIPIYEICNIVRKAGAERVLWGTDSPYADFQRELQKMDALVALGAYDAVLGDNAVSLFNIG